MHYVGVGRRLLALLVDTLIGFVGFGFAIALFTGNASSSPGQVGFELQGTSALALYALLFGYFVVMEATLGATLGKLLVGLRVQRADGARVGWGASLVRNLLRPIDLAFLGLVGAALIWGSPRRQRLGDRVAGTVVVRRPAAQPVTVPAGLETGYPVPFVEGL
jgi:uncharacterized RDD family membrane protein YckC